MIIFARGSTLFAVAVKRLPTRLPSSAGELLSKVMPKQRATRRELTRLGERWGLQVKWQTDACALGAALWGQTTRVHTPNARFAESVSVMGCDCNNCPAFYRGRITVSN